MLSMQAFLIPYITDYKLITWILWEMRNKKDKSRFFVKFGGKFFSAHLANSVSAYIFLWKWVKRDNY